MRMKKPYPIKISPTPIISAIVELRFEISCPADAVFGLVYHKLKDSYPLTERFPILPIQDEVKLKENLPETPYYRFSQANASLAVLVGPKIFVFTYSKKDLKNIDDYPGWNEYIKPELLELYGWLFSLKFISKVTRLGIRYNDFFPKINIFDYTEVNLLNKNGERQDEGKTQILQTIERNNVRNNITISNNAAFKSKNGELVLGSMTDIDSLRNSFETDFFTDYQRYLQDCHNINKELFFEMLKKELIDDYNPLYEG